MDISNYGVYQISTQFFIDFPDPYLKGNKDENRPHYLCFKNNGLCWMIPFTSQQHKIDDFTDRLKNNKPTDIYHSTNLDGKQGILLIADMFPVTPEYIKEAYQILHKPIVFKDTSEIKIIDKKARKILALLRKGIKFTYTQPDVFSIEKSLLEKINTIKV